MHPLEFCLKKAFLENRKKKHQIDETIEAYILYRKES